MRFIACVVSAILIFSAYFDCFANALEKVLYKKCDDSFPLKCVDRPDLANCHLNEIFKIFQSLDTCQVFAMLGFCSSTIYVQAMRQHCETTFFHHCAYYDYIKSIIPMSSQTLKEDNPEQANKAFKDITVNMSCKELVLNFGCLSNSHIFSTSLIMTVCPETYYKNCVANKRIQQMVNSEQNVYTFDESVDDKITKLTKIC